MKGSYVIYMSVFVVSFLFSFLTFKSESKSLRLFIPLLFLGLLTEGIVHYEKFHSRNILPVVYRIYIPVEYMFMGMIYFFNVRNKFIRKLIIASMIFFGIFCFMLMITATKISGWPSLEFNVEGFLMLVIASYHLLSLNGEDGESIFWRPFFWIDGAFLLFYSGTFFLMSLYDKLKMADAYKAGLYLSSINRGLNILLYLLFIVAFLCSARARQSYRS